MINRELLILLLAVLYFIACEAQNQPVNNADVSSRAFDGAVTVSLLELLSNPNADFSEIVIESPDAYIRDNLLVAIQSLSENKNINEIDPERRIAAKVELVTVCNDDNLDTDCDYVSEYYAILSRVKNILNVQCQYGSYRSTDEWF